MWAVREEVATTVPMHSRSHRNSHTLFIINCRMVFLTHAPEITSLSLHSIPPPPAPYFFSSQAPPQFECKNSNKHLPMASLQITAPATRSIGSLRRHSAVFRAPSVLSSAPFHRCFQAHPNFRYNSSLFCPSIVYSVCLVLLILSTIT